MAGHISSAGNVTWRTPERIVQLVSAFFSGLIELDPCATGGRGEDVALDNISLPKDGLKAEWGDRRVYVNPPFGTSYVKGSECITPKELKARVKAKVAQDFEWRKQTIGQWVRKADDEHRNNLAEVVMLLPAAVDTAHWHSLVFPSMGAAGICLIRGRLKFIGAEQGAPMPCALVYFGEHGRRFRGFFEPLGHCLVRP